MRALTETTAKLYEEILAKAYPAGPPHGADLRRVGEWKESTRQLLRFAIKRWWSVAGDLQRGIREAASIPKGLKTDVRYKYPTAEELEKLEAAVDGPDVPPRFRLAWQVLIRSGLRSKEFLELSRGDVEEAITRGELRVVGKGNKERVIEARQLRKAFAGLLDLPAAIGGRWHVVREAYGTGSLKSCRSNVDRWLRRLADSAGLDPSSWSPHRLRHGFALRASKRVSLQYLQAHLGHKSIETTGRYLHADREEGARLL